MSEKFKDIYRIESARLQGCDYGRNDAYFVTICTANRENFFGKIKDSQIELSEIGGIAGLCWRKIPGQFQYVLLDSYVIMPNHIHGIIIIDKTKYPADAPRRDAINRVSTIITNHVSTTNRISTDRVSTNRVSTKNKTNKTGGITGAKNPMLHDNLSRIIRWFKGRVKFELREIKPDFSWQARFYDHIIRDDESYCKIRQYIENNPLTWNNDKLYNN